MTGFIGDLALLSSMTIAFIAGMAVAYVLLVWNDTRRKRLAAAE